MSLDRPASTTIRLLLADVDGTLVDEHKQLTERTIAAVRRLRAAGIAFAITSGRPPKGMAMLIEPLTLDQPIAGFNGGVFANPDLTVIERHPLGAEVAAKTIKLIEDAGLDCWLYSGEDWFIKKLDAPHVAKEAHTVQFDAKVADSYDELLGDAIKIVGVSDDLDRVARTEAAVKQALSTTATAARSQPYYLDVTDPQANKGAVVESLAKRLGLSLDEIATIGDMPNDVLMFDKSGLAIAMGNASDEVKNQAHFATGPNTEDGFADAVEKYVLQRAGR